MDLRDLISLHQLTLAANGRSPRTQEQYLYFHSVFLDGLKVLGIPPSLDALTPINLRQVQLWYRSRTDRRRSRNGEVAERALVDLVKRLGAFGEEEGVYEDNPLRKTKRVRITKHLREPFSRQEINALWAACRQTSHPNRDEALFLLLLDTGMRVGEATGLTLSRLHLEDEERYVLVGAVGKARRERKVPLGDPTKRDGGRTVRALRRWLAERRSGSRTGEALFLARDGYPLTASGANDAMHRIGKLAGVTECYPHRLRHTFCTWYLTAYVGDEIGLRRLVGHLSRDVLSDYVHLADTAIQERAGRVRFSETLTASLQRVR